MENQIQEQSLFHFRIDERGKQYITRSAQWAMIGVIVTVIGYVLDIVSMFMPKKSLRYSSYGDFETASQVSGPNILGGLIGLIIGGVLTFLLYQFANFSKRAVVENNSELLAKGFMGLKNYFLVSSILIIIAIGFMILGILFIATVGLGR